MPMGKREHERFEYRFRALKAIRKEIATLTEWVDYCADREIDMHPYPMPLTLKPFSGRELDLFQTVKCMLIRKSPTPTTSRK